MEGLELRDIVVSGLSEPVNLKIRRGAFGAATVGDQDVATRLADVVTGHARPRQGTVLVDGEPVVRRRFADGPVVGLVPAGGGLLPHLPVAANIRYGLQHGDGRRRQPLDELVREKARQLRLLDALDHRPAELTPTRRLRVGLARALLREPSVVLLEDRTGEPAWAAALPGHEPLAGVAVLVITDDPLRLAGIEFEARWPVAAGDDGTAAGDV